MEGNEFELIWKNFATPKATVTLRRLLWDKLPTEGNLRKRKVIVSDEDAKSTAFVRVEVESSVYFSSNAI